METKLEKELLNTKQCKICFKWYPVSLHGFNLYAEHMLKVHGDKIDKEDKNHE